MSLSTLNKKTEGNTLKLTELHSELQSKANQQDVARGYVKKEVFTELMKSLGEEVDLKSTIEDMRKQENEIQVFSLALELLTSPQNIYSNLTSHDSQLQVAMRFIEWFTHRGEIYDYNIKVIDKHLSKLATSSITPQTPHQFQDYSENITYLPKYRSKEIPNERR